jgi:hypothetical protein
MRCWGGGLLAQCGATSSTLLRTGGKESGPRTVLNIARREAVHAEDS